MSKNTAAIESTPTTVNLTKDESIVVVNAEIAEMLSEVFTAQDNIENESKFVRGFLFDAVKARRQYLLNQNVQTWERTIDKYQRLHPTVTRDQAIAELMEAKSNKALFESAALSTELLNKSK